MKIGLSKTKNPSKFDFLLLAYLVLMAITSLFSIHAAFGLVGSSAGWGYFYKQLMWFIIGFIALSAIIYLGNDAMLDFAKIAYWILMGCLVYLFLSKILYMITTHSLPFVQEQTNGAISWFIFPGIGSFQPSEFMKIVLILITAGIIDKHNKNKVTDSYELDFTLFMDVAKWAIPPILLIFLQPDTGVVLIIAISLFAMIICSGIKRQWLIIIATLAVVSLILFFYMYYNHFDTLNNLIGGAGGYKMKRITSWLNPETDINNTGHQLYTALLAIGSAGFSGWGPGLELVAIPEAQTDFIFAVIGQSWGLIGTIFILLLCVGLDIHLCRIASASTNMFEKYFILGVLGMLLYQQVQNIGMIVGLLPITGITLPLISYGGSSLLSYLATFGIIMNASAKNKSKI
ncbi:MAG: FtsW/RodA/SpoVE family cell cycle protein [Longicatena sp.]